MKSFSKGFIGIVFSAGLATIVGCGGSNSITVESAALSEVPDGSGASFDLVINDSRVVAKTGNNITLTLIDVDTITLAGGEFAGFGGLTDFRVTLEHIGFGEPQVAFSNPLNAQTYICIAALKGTYSFNTGSDKTLTLACGTGTVPDQLGQDKVIAPGSYAAPSGFSSAWNGKPVSGTWRLRVTDGNINTGAGLFVWKAGWKWRLDINLSDGT